MTKVFPTTTFKHHSSAAIANRKYWYSPISRPIHLPVYNLPSWQTTIHRMLTNNPISRRLKILTRTIRTLPVTITITRKNSLLQTRMRMPMPMHNSNGSNLVTMDMPAMHQLGSHLNHSGIQAWRHPHSLPSHPQQHPQTPTQCST